MRIPKLFDSAHPKITIDQLIKALSGKSGALQQEIAFQQTGAMLYKHAMDKWAPWIVNSSNPGYTASIVALAQDFTQEALVKIHKHLGKASVNENNFTPLIYLLLKRVAIDYIRDHCLPPPAASQGNPPSKQPPTTTSMPKPRSPKPPPAQAASGDGHAEKYKKTLIPKIPSSYFSQLLVDYDCDNENDYDPADTLVLIDEVQRKFDLRILMKNIRQSRAISEDSKKVLSKRYIEGLQINQIALIFCKIKDNNYVSNNVAQMANNVTQIQNRDLAKLGKDKTFVSKWGDYLDL